jgi:hypothetical protein
LLTVETELEASFDAWMDNDLERDTEVVSAEEEDIETEKSQSPPVETEELRKLNSLIDRAYRPAEEEAAGNAALVNSDPVNGLDEVDAAELEDSDSSRYEEVDEEYDDRILQWVQSQAYRRVVDEVAGEENLELDWDDSGLEPPRQRSSADADTFVDWASWGQTAKITGGYIGIHKLQLEYTS